MRIFHHISKKNTCANTSQFAGRPNMRVMNNIDIMKTTVMNMMGKRLTYEMLVG